MLKNMIFMLAFIGLLFSCTYPVDPGSTGPSDNTMLFADHTDAKTMMRTVNKPVEDELVNIAYGVIPKASSEYSDTYRLHHAVDEDAATFWATSTQNTWQWIYVDLRRIITVEGIGLTWFDKYYAKEYDVYVSNDLQTWTKVYSQTAGTGGSEELYATVTCRYIGISLVKKNDIAYAMREFEVFKKKSDILSLGPELESAVRQAANISGPYVYRDDLKGITELGLDGEGLSDLSGLEHCINLESLSLARNSLTDIGIIGTLTKLRSLRLTQNRLSDISGLGGLTQLTELYLDRNTNIKDITALKNLTSLEVLFINNNDIDDITVLQYLTRLTNLAIYHNPISDIRPLSRLTGLMYLFMDNCNIIDISPIRNHTALVRLIAGFNPITDISPISNLTGLTMLHLNHNMISDLTPLENLTELVDLQLQMNYTISDITPLGNLTNLKYLNLYINDIKDITPLSNLSMLSTLNITNNNMLIKDDGAQGTINLDIVNAHIGNGCNVKWEAGNIIE